MTRPRGRWLRLVAATACFMSVPSWMPAAEAAPTVSPTACGSTTHKKADGTAYVCSFADDFATSRLDTAKWVVKTTESHGYRSGDECVTGSPNNVSVKNGSLNLTVRKESKPFTCKSPYGSFTTQYTGASVTSYSKFAQAYGRFEFRAAFPSTKVKGVQGALWLYPEKLTYGAWPGSGEIDVAEMYSQYPDRVIPYVHYPLATWDETVTNNYCMVTDVSAFHTYVAEWTKTGLTVSIDGKTCVDHRWNPLAPLTGSQPFDQPFALVMTQVLGIGTNQFNASTTPLPATTKVDWVRVWK